MGTSPEPPRPPAPPVPPAPPRTGSHAAAIALLILALIVVSSAIAVWIGLRILARSVHIQVERDGASQKEVSVKTPMGSFEVRKDVNDAQLGLPIYPGAIRVKDEDSASVNFNFGSEESVRIAVAKYETDDPVDKVVSYYRERLGNEITKFSEKPAEGAKVLEIKHDKLEKAVAVKERNGKTRIELVRVSHGRDETN